MRKWMLLMVLAIAFRASALRTIDVADYIAALEHIDALLASNQLLAAQVEARDLLAAEVQWSKGTFVSDGSLLQSIVDAAKAEGPHRARLLVTIAELRRAAGMETAHTDRKLLERIAAEQEAPELPKGGDVETTLDPDLPLFERVANAIADAFRWIGRMLRKILEWFLDLLPSSRSANAGGTPGLRFVVIAVVILIVLLVLILAIDVIRRSRATPPASVETSAPIGSKIDEDPLSRGAQEWERYAGELANAGRYREAIRAWYHAVLVTCYAAGILHFRKGRTNWEYVALLSPSLAWRPEVIELTRRFEQEWYGADQSSEDALDECGSRARRVLDALQREMRGAA